MCSVCDVALSWGWVSIGFVLYFLSVCLQAASVMQNQQVQQLWVPHDFISSHWQILSVSVVLKVSKALLMNSCKGLPQTQQQQLSECRRVWNNALECVTGCREWWRAQWEVRQPESGDCLISPASLKRKCWCIYQKIRGTLSYLSYSHLNCMALCDGNGPHAAPHAGLLLISWNSSVMIVMFWRNKLCTICFYTSLWL